jgi:UPF0755 protein
MKFLNVFIALCLFGAAAVAIPSWFLGVFEKQGDGVEFTVSKGENFAGLASKLQAQGVVKSERALRWYVNFFPPAKSLKRGQFQLYKNMSVPAVVAALTEGKPLEILFTVPEGHNIFQVAEALEAKGFVKKEDFLKACKSGEVISLIPTVKSGERLPTSVEGYLFPDTYSLQRVFNAREIAQLMLQRFREVYQGIEGELQSSPTVKELGLTPHEVVTFASIVEKETGAAQERPLIASVFVNRFRKKMRLQTDPTVIYGVWEAQGSWDGNIRRRDLQNPTDYNTYQKDGLPIGPIANPGLNAIKAVLNPDSSEFLYFVSKNNGTHVFSKDYASHNRAVRETQLNPKAKDGKSWRDLPTEQKAR